MSADRNSDGAGVYTQTNDPGGNQIIAYRRAADGTHTQLGAYDTGGLGTGKPHLASQGSVVLSDDGRWLFAVNAGSDDLSVLAVAADGLALVDRVEAGGVRPTSVTAHHDLLFVLSTGDQDAPASLHGFKLGDDGQLARLEGSRRQLSQPDADPAQIGFSPDGRTLVVTERATDTISSYEIGQNGRAEGPTVLASSGATPYGFDFTRAGVLVVTEAAGGKIGAASASSYALAGPGSLSLVSGLVGNTRSEVCWAAISPDSRHVYVTNFGDGTISSYTTAADGRLELLQPVAGTTVEGQKGIRDEAISRDGRYLYALHADVQQLFCWRVHQDGTLTPVAAFGDLPTTVAGLAASQSSWPTPTGLVRAADGRRLSVTDGGARAGITCIRRRPPTSAAFVCGVLAW